MRKTRDSLLSAPPLGWAGEGKLSAFTNSSPLHQLGFHVVSAQIVSPGPLHLKWQLTVEEPRPSHASKKSRATGIEQVVRCSRF